VGDYIALYQKVTNHILYSEDFKETNKISKYISPLPNSDKYWVINNLNITENTGYHTPYTYNDLPLFDTITKSNIGKVEHSIYQTIPYKLDKIMIFSCYVKLTKDSATENLSLSIFNDYYNIGVSTKFNLKTQTAVNSKITTKYTTDIDTNLSDKLTQYHSGIEKIENEKDCYRCYITCKSPFAYQHRCQMNILNKDGEYLYSSSAEEQKYLMCISGFQLEFVDDENNITIIPDQYIRTRHKQLSNNLFAGLYKITNKDETTIEYEYLKNNSIHYFESIQKGNPPIYELLDDNNLIAGDLGILPTIISFAEEPNSPAIMFGNGVVEDAPNGSLTYDITDKKYKIKKGSDYKALKSTTPTNSSIVKSMVFNQGYFETWSGQGDYDFEYGFNTGGGFNFFKKNKLGF
jgi:hypothetical protein